MNNLNEAKVVLATYMLNEIKQDLTDLVDGLDMQNLKDYINNKTPKKGRDDIKKVLFRIQCRLDDDILTNKILNLEQLLEIGND